jgi:hypothetical protein
MKDDKATQRPQQALKGRRIYTETFCKFFDCRSGSIDLIW